MATPIRFVDVPDLFTRLFNVTKGATFAQLFVVTKPPLPKSSCYYDRVEKKQTHNVQLNGIYSNAVNNQLMAEGKEPEFVPKELSWGVRIPGTPLLQHRKKGESEVSTYLMTRVLKSSPSSFFLDGKHIDDLPTLDLVLGHMRQPYSNKAHQGVDKEIIIRTFKLDSIRAITLDGETLIVERS